MGIAGSYPIGIIAVVALAAPVSAHAQRWADATAETIGTTAEWTNKVELVDVDGDGRLDAVLANGRGYSSPGTPERSRVFRNTGRFGGGTPAFIEITDAVLGTATGHARVIKLADVDGDGDDDLFVGNTYGDASRLLRRDATGWTDITATYLPAATPWVGDADFGDLDRDGDLDLVLADWGTDLAAGATPRVYINDAGRYVDATATLMPPITVRWSWELDLVDVDNDFDLDLLVASKLGTGSFLLRNNGFGSFDEDPGGLPPFPNNYEVEAMDIDADGDLDLVTLNDGPSLRDHILVNDGGRYVDGTAARLTGTANPAEDDNMAAFADVDSDGDADLVVGSLSGPDRLLLNNGLGMFTLEVGAIPGTTPGTLGIALGDVDGDHRPDLLMGQGEAAFPDHLYRATAEVAVDTTRPVIQAQWVGPGEQLVAARVHDRASRQVRGDLTVVLRSDGVETAMTWYGEHLWRGDLGAPGYHEYQVCARDRAGNADCSETLVTWSGGDDLPYDQDAWGFPDAGGPGHDGDHGGCGCRGGGGDAAGGSAAIVLVAIGLGALARARRRRAVATRVATRAS